MGTFVRGIATAATAVVLVAAGSAPAGAQELRGQPPAPCPTSPTYDPGAPTPEAFLGFPLGTGQQRVVTNDEIRRYVAAVDGSSDRVTGTMATSVTGRPLPYAIVRSSHVKAASPRSRRTSATCVPRAMAPSRAARIAHDGPAIVWVAGNVHGGEKSGADAALKTLYELAAGCPARSRSATTTSSPSSCRPRTRTAATRRGGRTSTAST